MNYKPMIKSRLNSSIAVLFLTSMLSVCTSFGVSKGEQKIVHQFTISPDLSSVSATNTRGPVLSVQPIRMSPPYDTHRIAYSQAVHKINFYSRNEWADVPSKMLQPIFIQSFEKSNLFSAVIERGSRAIADILLDIEVLKVLHRFEEQLSYAEISMHLQLINLESKQVVATTILKRSEACQSNDPYGAVIAFNKAFTSILADAVAFVSMTLNKNP